MEYIITGATGYIGQNIIKQLLENGDNVTAIVHPGSKRIKLLPDDEHLTIIPCDMNDTASLLTLLNRHGVYYPYDTMIHLAWNGASGVNRNNPEIQQEDYNDSKKIYELAKILHCKSFFFSGSQAEYGHILQDGYQEQNETNKCNPRNEYGKAKLKFGEFLDSEEKNTKMKLYHGRIISTYGPKDQEHSLVSLMINNLAEGTTLNLGPCEHDWNFTYVEDLAKMVVGLVNSDAPSGTYNMASHDTRPLKEFVKVIENYTNWKGRCVIGGRPGNPASDVPLRPNVNKLNEYVRIDETSFKKGIANTIEDVLKSKKIQEKEMKR